MLAIKPLLALALALTLLPSTASADPPTASNPTDYQLRAVDQLILPAYQRFKTTTQTLARQTSEFCIAADNTGKAGNAGDTGLRQLQQAFIASMDSWQQTQLIRFGPIDFSLRAQRIQLWPDKRGNVSKHLRRLLASQSSDALQADNFVSGSVAVQGLSAMERLLFNADSNAASFTGKPANHYRCQLLTAIADNLNNIASGIIDDWIHNDTAYRQSIADAGSNHPGPFFEDAGEVDSKLLNALHTQLQVIVDQKLDRPLGSSLQRARSKRAENWRSGRSLANIRANLETTLQLYRLSFAPRLSQSQTELNQAIEDAFAATTAALAAIPMPLNLAVQSAEARPKVETLRQRASELKTLLGRRLPQATGIPLGFNSLDGD